ncbi:MAG: TfoX/Sxy family protein [Gammaproteobacteria bacterium]|nr:TfoX/Sxy family protein [Gammaproteobacteria bacterium]
MRNEKEFVTYVVDLMQSIGPVRAKAMFGGAGLFLDGLMFALVADNILYLKADAASAERFKSRGLEAFSYHKQGKNYSMAYFQVPDDALEDAEEMRDWANMAYTVALDAAARKRK